MAGTITISVSKVNQNLERIRFTCVGDASDGSFPETQTGFTVQGKVLMGLSNPGAPAPTADYDISINDEAGCDIMGGEMTDRSQTVSEQVMPLIGSGYDKRPVNDKLTIAITGNAVNSAEVVVDLFVEK